MASLHVIRFTQFDPPAPSERAGESGVVEFIRGALDYTRAFGGSEPACVDNNHSSVVPIGRVRRKLMRAPPPNIAAEPTVEGTFFPAVLLCSGWWERRQGVALADSTNWRDDLQRWLFCGFEQWGPSWDVNPTYDPTERYLIGQIGDGDEADSLPVVVAAPKAANIRDQLARGAQAFNVRARGFLCHRRNIKDAELQQRLRQWGKTFDFCLIVSANEQKHFVSPHGDAADLYSGYLWQCWLPQTLARFDSQTDKAAVLKPPPLADVYFLWEHTNLTRESAVRYNLDSLSQKTAFLRKEHGDLILIQKSSNLVEGEQALSQDDFHRFVISTPSLPTSDGKTNIQERQNGITQEK